MIKVRGEWVEEAATTYVILRIWDLRRLVVPLQWFIENPFENWSRHTANLFAPVFLWLDYRMPVAPLRAECLRLPAAAARRDARIDSVQVVEAGEYAVQIRCLTTTGAAPGAKRRPVYAASGAAACRSARTSVSGSCAPDTR